MRSIARVGVVALAGWISCATSGAAQVSPRDSTPRAVPGTGVIAGMVVSDETPGQPLRRATVSLVSEDLRVPLSTVTNDDGRFVFSGVAPGNYGVTASKPAYVGAFYGETQPGRGPGVPVAVRDGERVANVTVKMMRGGVIAGTLRAPTGLPEPQMTIIVVGTETVGGQRRLRLTGGRVTTDDRGAFRLYGLPPGDYFVQAQPAGILTGAMTGTADAPQTTAAEVSWAADVEAQSRLGQTPALAQLLASPPERGRTVNYASVFYPGTLDPANAVPITLGPHEERQGIDFMVQVVPTASISGIVTDPTGRPLPNASVSITAGHASLDVVTLLNPRAPIRTGADGAFTLAAVAPGSYTVSARAATSPGGPSALWALQSLEVAGRDVSGMTLATEPGMTFSGRLVFDAARLAAPTPDEIARARVIFTPVGSDGAEPASPGPGMAVVTAEVGGDGVFTATGLVPDGYRIAITVPGLRVGSSAAGQGWSLRSAMLGGEDVADRVIDIRPRENRAGLVATFTDRPSEVSGTLTDLAGRPASGYPIILFSTDRRDWTPASHRVVDARPSTAGAFRIVGLPAGQYYLCAVVDLDRGALEDPAYLASLIPGSLTIRVTDGAQTVQNLRLAGSR
jgi:Carboxypeptidase regulatory-like domain